jgi:glycosyltransferase involved in cell wall biosynthesis
MIELTALVISFNEKENIERTIAALQWVPEVLLIDSFSTDGTAEIARRSHANLRVVERSFDSFASQCNFGLAQVTTPWVLSLDADYIVTRDLAAEISSLPDRSDAAGYSAAFTYTVFGRPLPATIYPGRTVLYRRQLASYRDEGHGHRVHVDGRVFPLAAKIDHDDRKPLSRWIKSQDDYTKIEASHLLRAPDAQLSTQDRLRKRIYFAAPVMFVYLLFGRGLVFAGWPAWYYVLQRTIAEMLLSLRLITERHKLENGS